MKVESGIWKCEVEDEANNRNLLVSIELVILLMFNSLSGLSSALFPFDINEGIAIL